MKTATLGLSLYNYNTRGQTVHVRLTALAGRTVLDASIIFVRKALTSDVTAVFSDHRPAAPDSSRGAAARTPRRTAAGPPG